MEKKETVISMNKDWYRILDVYDYDSKTKSWEPSGIKLDMDEYECIVMLAKRYNSFVIRNEKGEMITCYKCFSCRVKLPRSNARNKRSVCPVPGYFWIRNLQQTKKGAVRLTNKIYPFGPVLYNH